MNGGTVLLKPIDAEYSTHLVLYNPSLRPHRVTIDRLLQDRDGAEVNLGDTIPKDEFLMKANQTRVLRVGAGIPADTTLPADGFLRIVSVPTEKGPNCDPKTLPADCDMRAQYAYQAVQIAFDSRAKEAQIFTFAGKAAGIVVLIALIALGIAKVNPLRRMGAGTWSFAQSWGSNVTIGAALLATFLSLTLFPERPHLMDKTAYGLLASLFTALVALAPLVYGLIRRDVQAEMGGNMVVDPQGYVLMFLLAGGLVLWGAIGQLLTIQTLVQDFVLGGGLDRGMGKILERLTQVLCALLLVYGIRSLFGTAKRSSADAATAQGTQPARALPAGMPLPVPTTLLPPLAEWPLL